MKFRNDMGMDKPSITEKDRNGTGAEESWQIQLPEISAKQCWRSSSVPFFPLRRRHDGFDVGKKSEAHFSQYAYFSSSLTYIGDFSVIRLYGS